MRILNADLNIICGKLSGLKCDVIVDDVNVSSPLEGEDVIRKACSDAFGKAYELKATSIAFPGLGCSKGFPVVGSSKIMTQEILKFLKKGEASVKEITICLESDAICKTFKETITGYVTHIQTMLGDEPYVTVDIIIELPEGVILIERSNPPYGWALPGGFVDPGESLEQAAIREAKEETNMDLKDMRKFRTYSDPGRDPRFHTGSTVFIAQGEGEPRFGDDAKGLKIVQYERLLDLEYAFDHKDIIKDYLQLKEKK